MPRFRPALALLCLLTVFSSTASAAPVNSQAGLLERVSKYLNSLSTIESDFVQLAPDGSLATGKFFLKRPGKMRWQYDPPIPVLMISNGKFLIYYDYELQQVSNIPLDDTLAGFLAQAKIDFDPDVIKVLQAEAVNNVIRIRITLQDAPEDGELTMELTDSPLQLRNLMLKDKEGKETNVSLSNAKYGHPLQESLFIFKDPRTNKHPRRR